MENENSAGVMQNDFGVKFVDPESVVGQLKISTGMKVADFGCGAGYFSLALAKKVGAGGVVYAFDIMPEKLEATTSNAKNNNLTNIVTQRANLESANGSKLESGSVDLVVLKDMLFQNKKKKDILAEAARVLKDGGHALVVEWNMYNNALGPDQQMRISKEALLTIARAAGLGEVSKIEAGNFHYGVLFAK
jgi:ubiquinone/menaquinone biosynthesis C-methylase UbiE